MGTEETSYRVRDTVLAGIGLAVLAPLGLGVAIAIKLDSAGPVFFRQVRVGRDGRLFRIHKFRTMTVSEDGPDVSAANDRRITQVGRVLRMTKLDEIPQLLDVLAGDMSLVGPRPEVPRYVSEWPERLRPLILSVRPGVTDPASVHFRHEDELLAHCSDPERVYVDKILPRKAEMYAEYVRTRSFFGDLRVLYSTFLSLVSPPPKVAPGE